MNDKLIEKGRYDARAKAKSDAKGQLVAGDDYLYSMSVDLQLPYVFLKQQLETHLDVSKTVLEIGSGMGAITKWLVLSGAKVIASDISPHSIQLLNDRFGEISNFEAVEADMEALPFADHSFDIVVSAGSLSYGDNETTMHEIFRVLRYGGTFICVDSLSHNPIYRMNRYLHYMFSRRTLSTLKRMPKVDMINRYRDVFGQVELRFFGSITWLFPLLRRLVGSGHTARIGQWCDERFNVRKSAFKFVMVVTKQYGNK